ncbi:polyprenyl synthetase family protein [Streptomyces sp. URMC 127]|uniref:polyprenyl synthetase family protein n=1 Tax=Streptomyces sp. URMC 127 TaxID=3423402 RepID=UPI003F1A122D
MITRAREFVRPSLELAVSRLHPDLAKVSGYYFGWYDAEGKAIKGRGSRSLQACMAMLAAEACGANPQAVLPAAVAVELLHNLSLLHDDIIDRDAIRRGRPAAWVVFGTGTSLIASDALWTAAIEELLKVPQPDMALKAVTELNTSMSRIIHAAASEATFDRTAATDIALNEYMDICAIKGGELLGVAAATSTLLAGGPESTAEGLRRAAHHAGAAWQATNDLENIWGDTTLVGKPGFQDLRQRKHTLPIIAALKNDHPAARELARLLARPDLDEAGMNQAAEMIEELGGRATAEQEIQKHLTYALRELGQLELDPSAHQDLTDLLEFAVTRHSKGNEATASMPKLRTL